MAVERYVWIFLKVFFVGSVDLSGFKRFSDDFLINYSCVDEGGKSVGI